MLALLDLLADLRKEIKGRNTIRSIHDKKNSFKLKLSPTLDLN